MRHQHPLVWTKLAGSYGGSSLIQMVPKLLIHPPLSSTFFNLPWIQLSFSSCLVNITKQQVQMKSNHWTPLNNPLNNPSPISPVASIDFLVISSPSPSVLQHVPSISPRQSPDPTDATAHHCQAKANRVDQGARFSAEPSGRRVTKCWWLGEFLQNLQGEKSSVLWGFKDV